MAEFLQLYPWGGLAALIGLGMAPSALWLGYYLKQDDHPEPKRAIFRVFCYGFISTFAAFAIEWAIIRLALAQAAACQNCGSIASQLLESGSAISVALSFLFLSILALTEEWVKYATARIGIIRSRFFDEPVDAMIYLVVAALGFAAAENIGYILQNPDNAIGIAYLRFLSSTSLHALSSAIIGYFLTVSIIHKRNKAAYIAVGIACATLLHAMFNFLIITAEWQQHATLSIIMLMFAAFSIVSILFKNAKRLSFTNAQF